MGNTPDHGPLEGMGAVSPEIQVIADEYAQLIKINKTMIATFDPRIPMTMNEVIIEPDSPWFVEAESAYPEYALGQEGAMLRVLGMSIEQLPDDREEGEFQVDHKDGGMDQLKMVPIKDENDGIRLTIPVWTQILVDEDGGQTTRIYLMSYDRADELREKFRDQIVLRPAAVVIDASLPEMQEMAEEASTEDVPELGDLDDQRRRLARRVIPFLGQLLVKGKDLERARDEYAFTWNYNAEELAAEQSVVNYFDRTERYQRLRNLDRQVKLRRIRLGLEGIAAGLLAATGLSVAGEEMAEWTGYTAARAAGVFAGFTAGVFSLINGPMRADEARKKLKKFTDIPYNEAQFGDVLGQMYDEEHRAREYQLFLSFFRRRPKEYQ